MIVNTAPPSAIATGQTALGDPQCSIKGHGIQDNGTEGQGQSTQLTTTSDAPAQEASTALATSTAGDSSAPGVDDSEKAKNEKMFWEEARLLGLLRECEDTRDQLESSLKKLQDRKKKIEEELRNLDVRIPEVNDQVSDAREATLSTAKSLWRLRKGEAVADQEATETIAPADSPAQPTITNQTESTEWRNLSTGQLLASVKGIGKGKLDAICHLAPTVGHLEDLRGEASKACVAFKNMLPKGCGQAVSDLIEDCLITHIANVAKKATGTSSNALADELLASIRERADGVWRPEDCVADDNDSEHTRLGRSAYEEGKPHTALPTRNPDLARDWMVGWVCAEVIAAAKKQQPETESSSTKKESQAQDTEGNPNIGDPNTDGTSASTKPKRGRKPKSASAVAETARTA